MGDRVPRASFKGHIHVIFRSRAAPELLAPWPIRATQPTPIQREAIPAVLAGRDVLAGAQTGTGKTAGFVLPILQRLTRPRGARAAARAGPRRPRASSPRRSPTAPQLRQVPPLRTQVVFGGVSINPQIGALRGGCDILVATPGRLLDLAQQGAVDLSQRRRCWCSTKPTACSTWASSTTSGASSSSCRSSARTCCSRRPIPTTSATRRAAAARSAAIEVAPRNADGRNGRADGLPRAEGPQAAPAGAPDQGGQLAPGAGVHAHQARRQPPRPAAGGARHQRRRDPRQQEPGRAHPGAGGVQGQSHHRAGRDRSRGARPRHQGTAASSSTTSCRTCRRTTCTASAARRAPAPTGQAVSLVSPDETSYLRDIERLLGRTSRPCRRRRSRSAIRVRRPPRPGARSVAGASTRTRNAVAVSRAARVVATTAASVRGPSGRAAALVRLLLRWVA